MPRPEPPVSFDDFEIVLRKAAVALREERPEDLPKVEFPWREFWPTQDSPEFMWRAFSKWNSFANRYIQREINDVGFRENTRTEFPPPLDEQFLGWWADIIRIRVSAGRLRPGAASRHVE